MALTATQTGIVQLIVGMFDAAPGKSYLDAFTAQATAGQTLDQLATELSGTAAFLAIYPATQTNNEFATAFVNNLVGNTVTSTPLAFAVNFVESQLTAGTSIAKVIQIATQELLDAGSSHADFGVASATLANQIKGASNYSETQDSKDLSVLQGVIAKITDDVATIPAVVPIAVPGETQHFTVDQDHLTGTANNDSFLGYIFDNQNTGQSGDTVNGGAGHDLVGIEVGNSQDFAISMKTTNVEQVIVRAQAVADDSNDNNMTASQIDAQDMVGVTRYDSNNSRADVVIEDVRIEDSEVTADITVAMVETDPGMVDYGLYFDQPSLRAAAAVSAGAVLNIELMDTRSAAAGEDPLKESPYNAFTFTLDGTTYKLDSQEINDAQTYAELLVAIQDQLVNTTGLENITASITGTFEATDTDTAITTEGQTITLTNSAAGTFGVGTFIADDGVPASSGLHTNQDTTPPTQTGNLITSQILLDHVGRGSMGGDLIVGGLSTGDTSDSKGVEQFNITVERDSELQEIHSTNNTLREVFIKNGTNKGDLVVAGDTEIDNDLPGSSTATGGFTDVRILDASAMVGSVDIDAELTGAVVNKYMNLVDTDGNAAADDAEFVYTLGTNDDNLDLDISNSNLAAAGTTSREDFSLVVNGAGGDDTITTIIGDGTGTDSTNWYLNSQNEANLEVNGDAGNDTITTTGAGDFDINAGSGNDTVYTDNSGAVSHAVGANGGGVVTSNHKATWVVNAANVELGNLQGNAPSLTAAQTLLYKSVLTVTFSGASVNAAGGVASGAAVQAHGLAANAANNGFESSVTIPTTDYVGNMTDVNQAIKLAINSDAVLSKLLVAEDGPGSTLVIKSLIDGEFAATDLDFTVSPLSPAGFAALTASELAGLDTAWETLNADSTIAAVAQTDLAAAATAANALVDTEVFAQDDGATNIVGADSAAASDNMINLGTGDDVVVLGTANGGPADSNDTLIFAGSFGNDTVVNFENAATSFQDKLDFTAYLGGEVYAAGSTSEESKSDIATTGDNTGVAANVLAANAVATVTDFTGAGTETWAALTGANVFAAINSTTNLASANDYANLTAASFTVATNAQLVGNVQKGIIMIENDFNQGEYKVFETFANDTTAEFTDVKLVGTIDFGQSIDASVAGTLV